MIHHKARHEGVKYPCIRCGFKASSKRFLLSHSKGKHEGVKFLCVQCHYKASQKGTLLIHVKSKHMGRKWKMRKFHLIIHLRQFTASKESLIKSRDWKCDPICLGIYFYFISNIEYLIYNYITSYSILFAYNVLKRYLVGFANMLFRSKKHPTLGQMHSMLKRTKNGRRQGDSLLYRYSFF